MNNNKTHGMKGTSTWIIWMGIKARCLNPNNNAYKNYGGRGIRVCDKWLKFEGFLEDMGTRPDGLQIDRLDNDQGYFKDNCMWVTAKENSNNRRKSRIFMENNLSGLTFNRWYVIEKIKCPVKNKWYFKCRCECGTEALVLGKALKSNDSTQCRHCKDLQHRGPRKTKINDKY